MNQPTFDLEWFLGQLQKLKSVGPISELIKMVPGMSAQMDGLDANESELYHFEAIILAMTPWERRHAGMIDPSRQQRIARGSGVQEQEVAHLLAAFHLVRAIKRGPEKGLQ